MPDNRNSVPERSHATKEVILSDKRSDLQKCINSFFDIGGLQMPIELLKELLFEYTDHAKNHPWAEFDFDRVSQNTFYTIEIISFLSVLHEKFTEVREMEQEISRN